MMKNYDKLLEFASKLPTINNQPYYEFKQFDFEDFDYIGYETVESYKEILLGTLYANVYAHFSAAAEKGLTRKTGEIYYNSILFVPGYFKYSNGEKELKQLYHQMKK